MGDVKKVIEGGRGRWCERLSALCEFGEDALALIEEEGGELAGEQSVGSV